jgi:hypothetical protein
MTLKELVERQSKIESKADFESFQSDFKYWDGMNEFAIKRLFGIAAAWRSIQLLALEMGADNVSSEVKREHKQLQNYRSSYDWNALKRADKHFLHIKTA